MCKYVYILQCVYRYAVCKHTHTLYYYRKIPKKALRNATTHSHSTNAPNTSNINPHSREDASTYEVIKSISSRSYCIPVCTAALATSHITNTPNSNTNNTNNSNTNSRKMDPKLYKWNFIIDYTTDCAGWQYSDDTHATQWDRIYDPEKTVSVYVYIGG